MHHILHMVICCGLPVVIIMLLPFIAGFSPAIAALLGVIAPFICPVMMGLMFFMMFSGKKSGCCEKTDNEEENLQLPEK